MRCLDVACTPPELTGEAGRIQGGPWQVWLAWTARLRYASVSGFDRSDLLAVPVGVYVGLYVGFGFRSSVVSSRVRDTRCSVFGLLVLYLLRWFCLPCVRCFALLCVALRSFCVFRSG